MDHAPPPHQPDPSHQLQRDLYYELVRDLRSMLPPPIEDTPEDWARRDRVAIAKVAAMVPANPVEADLAAHHVGAMAQAADCLRLVVQSGADLKQAAQLRAQAARMGREARGSITKLLHAQAARLKREATPAACESAAFTEHCVAGLMTNALASIAPAPAEASAPLAPALTMASPPAAAPPSPPAQVRQPLLPAPPIPSPPIPSPRAAPAPAETAAQQPDLAAEAETYAILYPRRARLIRELGGLPTDCDFGPPEPELVHAIVTGTSLALRELDDAETVAA